MSAYLTPNETAAAVTSCDGLRFVSTTLSPPSGKAEDHALVYADDARSKPRI